MRVLIIYDSVHGNTNKIAQAIGEAIGGQVLRASEVDAADLQGFDLLIVGSPTHGGWFTPEIQSWLMALPALEGVSVAASIPGPCQRSGPCSLALPLQESPRV